MIQKVDVWIKKIEMVLVVIPFAFLCIMIVTEIAMRNFFQTGLPWLEEAGRYILVFGTFLGASIAISSDEHPRMEAVLLALPKKAAAVIRGVSDLICAGTAVVLDYFAWKQVLKMVEIGTRTSTLPIPLWVVYVIFPLALLGMTFRYLLAAWKHFKGINEVQDSEKEAGKC